MKKKVKIRKKLNSKFHWNERHVKIKRVYSEKTTASNSEYITIMGFHKKAKCFKKVYVTCSGVADYKT